MDPNDPMDMPQPATPTVAPTGFTDPENGVTAFVEDFQSPDALASRFHLQVFHGATTPPELTDWMGDHNLMCGGPETLRPVPDGEVGILRLDDCANVDTAVFLQTSDLARATGDGLELLGRAPGATPRGCSLAMDAILGAAR